MKNSIKTFWSRRNEIRFPTVEQLARWEDDGGNSNLYEDVIHINGRLYAGPMAKVRKVLNNAWNGVLSIFNVKSR
jgi:hypothetical protein